MLLPSDVVLCEFQGLEVSSAGLPSSFPLSCITKVALILCAAELTTQVMKARQPTSYLLQDWAIAGLRQASVFRCYFSMALQAEVSLIGRLSDRDWLEAQRRLRLGVAVM